MLKTTAKSDAAQDAWRCIRCGGELWIGSAHRFSPLLAPTNATHSLYSISYRYSSTLLNAYGDAG